MTYFDYEEVAREARIPSEKLDELRHLIKGEFPHDEMIYELHLLRAGLAVRNGVVTLQQALSLEQKNNA